MVETIGIEPMTPCMSSMYSNQLSYASARSVLYHIAFDIATLFLKKVKKFLILFMLLCLNGKNVIIISGFTAMVKLK